MLANIHEGHIFPITFESHLSVLAPLFLFVRVLFFHKGTPLIFSTIDGKSLARILALIWTNRTRSWTHACNSLLLPKDIVIVRKCGIGCAKFSRFYRGGGSCQKVLDKDTGSVGLASIIEFRGPVGVLARRENEWIGVRVLEFSMVCDL